MSTINELIRDKALMRLAKVLSIPIELLNNDLLFIDIEKSTPAADSIFRRNLFDVLLDDIRDVSNTKILKKIDSGDVEIKSVGDYINHMINCYSYCPNLVVGVLGDIDFRDHER